MNIIKGVGGGIIDNDFVLTIEFLWSGCIKGLA